MLCEKIQQVCGFASAPGYFVLLNVQHLEARPRRGKNIFGY